MQTLIDFLKLSGIIAVITGVAGCKSLLAILLIALIVFPCIWVVARFLYPDIDNELDKKIDPKVYEQEEGKKE